MNQQRDQSFHPRAALFFRAPRVDTRDCDFTRPSPPPSFRPFLVAPRERRFLLLSAVFSGARYSREANQGRTEDALASAGDEGRGKLRKCPGTRKQGLIRTCPNGATRAVFCRAPALMPGLTRGTETSQYPEEQKEIIDSPSSGERTGMQPKPCGFRAARCCRAGLMVGFDANRKRAGKPRRSG